MKRLARKIIDDLKRTTKYLHERLNMPLFKASVLKTPAFACNPAAKTEVHTSICSEHLYGYILSIKSLLSFHSNISVIVHDDGSLDGKDKRLLAEHVKGIRIIDKEYADARIEELLKDYPISRSYRKEYRNAIQLFDFAMMSAPGVTKIISLDSDTLFLKKPNALIEWIEQDDKKRAVCFYEESPFRQEIVGAKAGFGFQAHVNIGFLAYHNDMVDPQLIERVLAKIKEVDDIDWVTNQNICSILVKNKYSVDAISYFAEGEYQFPGRFTEQPVFRHYIGCMFGRLNPIILKDSRDVIRRIGKKY